MIGISVAFMTIDCLGGVFSDLSLAFKPKFDMLAAISYTLVAVRKFIPPHAYASPHGSRLSSGKPAGDGEILMVPDFQILDGLVIVAALILNPRARRRRNEADRVDNTETIAVDPRWHLGALAH